VGDLHVAVVHHVGKVVCWEAITLYDDEVVLGMPLLVAVVDDVFEHSGFRSAPEPYGELVPAVGPVVRLLKGHVLTCAWIAGRQTSLVGSFLVFF
jgi:hypothetical protein